MRVYVADAGRGNLGLAEGATHGAEGAVAGGGWVSEVVGVGSGGIGGECGVDGSGAGEGVVEFLLRLEGRGMRGEEWRSGEGDRQWVFGIRFCCQGVEGGGLWDEVMLPRGWGQGKATEKEKGKAYLQHHDPRPLSYHKAIPIPIERPGGPLRGSVRRRSQALGPLKACNG